MAESPESGSSRGAVSCDFCREKKYKCSKEKPSCQRCSSSGRTCHYTPPQVRSPLTRLYVTSVENRVRDLERLLHKLHPDMSIEEALASVDNAAVPITTPKHDDGAKAPDISEAVQNEALPLVATGFEWQETNQLVDNLADGMASLSVDPAGKGYLGSTSGAGLLRSLLSQNHQNTAVQTLRAQGSGFAPPSPNAMLMNFQVGEQLLNHQIITYLIDGYFANYHTSYPFIHEPSFRAAYSELLPRPPEPVWQILFYTVLTLGAWTVGDDNEVFDDYCYHKAVSHFQQQAIFEIGSLPLVQALVLLSNYVQKRNKPNTGSNYLGLAVRIALSLGLHRELPGWQIGLLEREMRRRLWWGLFIFDSGASTTFGRLILLPEDVDVKSVLNIPDEALTPSTTVLPTEWETPTIYSSLIYQSAFHTITNSMANRLLSGDSLTAKESLNMHSKFQAWRNSLPHYFDTMLALDGSAEWYVFAKAKLAWRGWNFEILAMRPFLLRWAMQNRTEPLQSRETAEEIQCRQICIDSAHATIASIHQYVTTSTMPRLHVWYALFFLFHATLVPMVCLRALPGSHDISFWIQDINTAKFLLESSFTNYALAQRCLDVINQLLPNGATNDLSQTQLDFSLSETGFESWFDWPGIEGEMHHPNLGSAG